MAQPVETKCARCRGFGFEHGVVPFAECTACRPGGVIRPRGHQARLEEVGHG